jgi:hypothetical protein
VRALHLLQLRAPAWLVIKKGLFHRNGFQSLLEPAAQREREACSRQASRSSLRTSTIAGLALGQGGALVGSV